MIYQNPILSGFHPDPSVCRVGEDYYLVNSTFEYFPGIPVYHSVDLIHWEQIGHVITRPNQVKLPKGAPNCISIYAPTIRYHQGTFYCIVTNVGSEGNIIFTTKDIYGEWSDPIRIPECEGIDPSLFFDDDGKVYYSGIDGRIFIAQIDVESGKLLSPKANVWDGSGANNPEGPHLYKINGYYYLMIAEGGTEAGHRETIARAKDIFGPYEDCPYNPILTNNGTDLPLKAIGHADLVDDVNGNWWAVCLGNRPLGYPFTHNMGRETMLTSLTWENDWPKMARDGRVYLEMDGPEILRTKEAKEKGEQIAKVVTPDGRNARGHYVAGSEMVDFAGSNREAEPASTEAFANLADRAEASVRIDAKPGALHPSWNYIYEPVGKLISLKEGRLVLGGNAVSLSEDDHKAFLVRRQEAFNFEAQVKLSFEPSGENEEAGIAIYMNPAHHYEAFLTLRAGRRSVVIRRRIGSLVAEENVIPVKEDAVWLRLSATREKYCFSVRENEDDEFKPLGQGECRYLTTEAGGCFTGNYLGLFASGNGKDCQKGAIFTHFSYKNVEEQTK